MRAVLRSCLAVCAVLSAGAMFATDADAACKRMGFLVNDYGKEGPTEDAKRLLDEHIAKWAAENGIKNYTVGKKDVTCELFLDLILFDEHTCTASANVCWDEGGGAAPAQSTSNSKPAVKKEAPKAAAKPQDQTKQDTAKSEARPTPTQPAAIETGAVPDQAAGASAAVPEAAPAPKPELDAAAKAAAAAERAAAAAERAAEAAERAAQSAAQPAATEPAVGATPPPASQLEMPAYGAGAPVNGSSAGSTSSP